MENFPEASELGNKTYNQYKKNVRRDKRKTRKTKPIEITIKKK